MAIVFQLFFCGKVTALRRARRRAAWPVLRTSPPAHLDMGPNRQGPGHNWQGKSSQGESCTLGAGGPGGPAGSGSAFNPRSGNWGGGVQAVVLSIEIQHGAPAAFPRTAEGGGKPRRTATRCLMVMRFTPHKQFSCGNPEAPHQGPTRVMRRIFTRRVRWSFSTDAVLGCILQSCRRGEREGSGFAGWPKAGRPRGARTYASSGARGYEQKHWRRRTCSRL